MIDLLGFIQKYLGKAQTGNTPENIGQCVGLIEVWTAANGKPHIVGNAVDLLANADSKAYRRVTNASSNYPPAGAVVCWGPSWGGGFGHTAVVVAATPLLLSVFEQNNPEQAPPLVATHSYDGVAGWLVLL